MNENGPLGMYTVKPLYDSSPQISLPTCMYKMDSIYTAGNSEPSPCSAHQDQTVSSDKIGYYQLSVVEKLETLKAQVLELKRELNIGNADSPIQETKKIVKPQDIVISANPNYPPYSIWVFRQLLSEVLKVQLVTYIHSSLVIVPDMIKNLEAKKDIRPPDITLTVIWKETVGKDPEMMIDPLRQGIIEGEVNIARYLSRLLTVSYDSDPFVAAQIDYWLETAHSSLIDGSTREQNTLLKTMNTELEKNSYLVGSTLSVADIVLWSLIRQNKLGPNFPTNVEKWWGNLNASAVFQPPINT